MRWVLVAGGAGVAALAGLAAAALLAWPAPALGSSQEALAQVALPLLAGRVESVRVTTAGGNAVPVRIRGGEVWPVRSLPQGETLTVEVTVRRPRWAAWLVGTTLSRTLTVTTPSVHVRTRYLRLGPGTPVAIGFDAPAAIVSLGGRERRLGTPDAKVATGVVATGARIAGSMEVAASPRPWEALSTPVRIGWFPPGPRSVVVATPSPGTRISPTQRLLLTFSAPVAEAVAAQAAGHWQVVDTHTVALVPPEAGFPLGGRVRVTLPASVHATLAGAERPARTLRWPVAPGTTLRLQQLLAQLGYLPLAWRPQSDPPTTSLAAQAQAAASPPAGIFTWRYRRTPAGLRALWQPGRLSILTRGAIMRFEEDHGLPADGVASTALWRKLFAAVLANDRSTSGYSYVFVHESVPESLSLWHNGKIVVVSPGNTGIAQAPTAEGTYPVFEHLPVGTMQGTNPDGTHYDDPGVRWISYFHGGDAIHAFPRSSYGTPQSLGCVELPYTAAEQVWPYTPVGTLVTVEP